MGYYIIYFNLVWDTYLRYWSGLQVVSNCEILGYGFVPNLILSIVDLRFTWYWEVITNCKVPTTDSSYCNRCWWIVLCPKIATKPGNGGLVQRRSETLRWSIWQEEEIRDSRADRTLTEPRCIISFRTIPEHGLSVFNKPS